MSGWFYNPYAFVPSDRYRGVANSQRILKDHPPEPLGRLHPDRWTGHLTVTVTAKTPLLLTTVSKRDDNGHRRRATTRRHGTDDCADLLATSFKGMLRAAYEAATDSRFGVFTSGDRLTSRVRAPEAPKFVPCRVTERDDRTATVLVLGTTRVMGKSMSAAAWVPRYDQCSNHDPASRVCCASPPVNTAIHGQEMYAFVAACVRPPRGRQREIPYWRVLDLASSEADLDKAKARQRLEKAPDGHRRVEDGQLRIAVGWYVETGRNIENKHYERFFIRRFVDGNGVDHVPIEISLTNAEERGKEVLDSWALVISGYRERHRGELRNVTINGHEYGPLEYVEYEDDAGAKRRKLALSRHVLPDFDGDDPLPELPEGTLCYAEFDDDSRLKTLHPVAIGRRASGKAPAELADVQGLTPASTPNVASAADRLFGWANATARRGRVRVAQCEQRDGGIDRLEASGLPLAVLSSPKPEQGWFYAGERDGSKLKKGTEAYSEGSGLRGRKVYPAARNPEVFNDGRRPDGKRDDQNASLLDRVPEGASFTIDIRLEDLAEAELGALAWLLSKEHLHRLGLGKPLGFGTVSISIDTEASHLATGQDWAARYRLDAREPVDVAATLESARAAFVTEASGTGGAEPRFLQALKRALEGLPDHDVRYPPDPDNPTSGTEHFKWFGKNASGPKRRLGDLTDETHGKGDWWRGMLLPANPKNNGDPPRPAAPQAPSGPQPSGQEDSEKKGAGKPVPKSAPRATPKDIAQAMDRRPPRGGRNG